MTFSKEPAMWIALIGAALGVAISFGLKITADQKTALDALIAVIVGLVTRSQVSPKSPAEPDA